MANEVIDADTAFADIPKGRPNKQMIEIAEKIIDQQQGAFEPAHFKDRYETALRDLIKRKERGEKVVTAEPPAETNVIDLMEALKKSLKNKGATAKAAPTKKRKAR
jgi:DNA end-binding protein Ku